MQPSGSNVGNPRVNATNYDIVSRPLTVFSGPIFLADEWLLLAGKSQPPALNSTRWNGRWTQ